jgi:hypothetical protein
MEEIKTDTTFQIFMSVSIFLTVLSGIFAVIHFLEEKEIARKKLNFQKSKP